MRPALSTLIATLVLGASACETARTRPEPGPKLTEPENSSTKRPDAPKSATVEPTKNRQKIVDGRVDVPAADGSTPNRLARVITYTYGETPAAFRPQSGSITIEPATNPISTPVKRSGVKIDQVMLAASDKRWEPDLLGRGITLIDRTHLKRMEQEHFLQGAPGAEVQTACENPAPWIYLPAAPAGNSEHKSPAPWADLNEWQNIDDRMLPWLRGHLVEESKSLAHGKLLPARWILEVGDISIESLKMTASGLRPVADWVDYLPEVAGEVQLPNLEKARWQRSSDDPFVFECTGGTTYLDPSSGALWAFEKAWLGHEVTRSEYIKRRTKRTDPQCAECGRKQPQNATTTAPSLESTPTHWYCTLCDSKYEVTYFDGYRSTMLPADHAQAIVRWRWVEPKPGIYPVLQPRGNVSGQTLLLSSDAVGRDATGLLKLTQPSDLLGEEAVRWCLVERTREGLILDPTQIAKLRSEVAPRFATPGTVPVPVTESDGRQVFLPTAQGYVPASVEVPIERASVVTRLVNVEDSSIAMSGTLVLSFLNTMEQSVRLPILAEGVDTSNWPSELARITKLETSLRRMLADIIAR